MADLNQPTKTVEAVFLIVGLALVLFATPVIYWWAQDDSPWYVLYLLWLIIIGLSAWLHSLRNKHDL